MEFRNLIGAECGRNNAVVELASHLTNDHTFRDTHEYHQFPSESDVLVEQFLQETRTIPQSFHMDGLLQEMREIESQRFNAPPIPASKVKDHLNDDDWALQYLENGSKFQEMPDQNEIWTQLAQEQQRSNELNEYGLGEGWAKEYIDHVNVDGSEAKEIQETANLFLDNIDDPKFTYSKFMKFMNQIGEGKVSIEDGKVIGEIEDPPADEWVKEFTANNKPEDMLGETWVGEYKEQTEENSEEGPSTDFWSKYKSEWQKLSSDENVSDHPWLSEFSEFYDPYKDYQFSETNPMENVSNPLEVGKKKLEDGDIPSAILCFESAVKQNREMAEAWQYLGTTQAENEQDPNAICALKKCLELDPTNLTALMALAVCFTNESYQNQACQTLVKWLKSNPKYSNFVPENFQYEGSIPSFLSQQQHKEVQDMFIKAVQRSPNDIDYEIQCCLGVLFNLSSEYEKAVDCFKTALQVRPDDAKLWNRLGATLANGERPEEAVEAYHNALNRAPGFIRARYNVGITCINLGVHKEAAEHFLIALNQQARGRDMLNLQSNSQMSEAIWSTLRMCVGLMNRNELKSLVDKRDLVELNKAFNMTDI